jgi:GT2 family glycosyltransferase
LSLPAPPRVLIGITTRNRAAILPKALASALAQQYPALEVAVLDDGSTDDTPALREKYPAVRWLRHEHAHGIIESRNELMQTIGASYFVSLDDDAWFLQGDEIALAVRRLETHPDVAAIAFDILSPDRPGKVARRGAVPTSMFIGCGHMVRLSSVRAVGCYAPTPGTYGSEEKDLALRLADRGFKIELLPGVHVWHDKAWTGRDWYPLHRSGVCNELFMTLRRCPLPDVLLVLPLKILSYFWFWFRQPAYFRAGLAGLWAFGCHLGDALRTRQAVRRATYWRMTRPLQ